MKKLLFLVTALLISASFAIGQEQITLGLGNADLTGYTVGQEVLIPVVVVSKTPGYDVIGFDFFIEFDHTYLQWPGTPGPGTNGFTGLNALFGAYAAGDWTWNDNGTALVSLWTDPTYTGLNFPDGAVLFNARFTYKGGLAPGMTSPLTWQTAKQLVGNDEIKLAKGVTNVYHQFFAPFTFVNKNPGSIFIPGGGTAPVADFMGVPTSGEAPLLVNFTDMSTGDPADSWAWDFGDLGTSTLQNPSHVYAAARTYTVSLTATNASGSDTETKVGYIVVTPPCVPGTWTGLGDGTSWFDAMNWSCDIVPENVNVTIPGGTKAVVTIAGGIATTATLTVGFGGGLVIAADGGLTTNGVYTNNGSLLIQSDGSGYSGTYINNAAIAGTGTFEFDRVMTCTGTSMNGTDPNWHYVAAPISGFTTWNMFDYYVNAWDEATSMWNHVGGMAPNCIPGPNVSLDPLAAWSINYAMDYSCEATNPGTGLTLEFMGGAAAMHTGPYAAPATFTPGAYQGWNMFSNPYPAGMDLNSIAFDPNMVPGVALYDGCFGNYAYWTPALGVYVMPVGNGFFTEWTGAGTFGVTNAARAHNADYFWKADVSDLVTLQITGNEKSDVTYIRFMENAQAGFSKDGDFHKLFSTAVPQIYTTAGEDMLAVNCLPETATVPMGMTSEVSGSYTISAIETSEFQNVVLEDLFTGIETDLLAGNYTFEYNVGDNANRFVIHFTPLGTPELGANNINIWAANQTIYVQAPATTGDIVVYNMMGQVVVKTAIEPGLNEIPMNDANTYYIVKVLGSDVTETGKVFIK
jgi:PKD repeat protein